MKACIIEAHGNTDGLALVDWPQPELGPHDVLVAMKAVSLNYRDLGTLRNARPGNLAPPLIPCSDGAGEVVAVGTQVTRFQIGNRVVGGFFRDWIEGRFSLDYHKASGGGSIHGVLREMIATPEWALVPVPETFSYAEAATWPVAGVTAWASLFTRGHLQAGATVLTLGTGGVSTFALQLASAAGARVITTSSSDEKLARAREMGAWETVNYKTTPEWDQEVLRHTQGQGVDHVIEVGGSGTLEKSTNCVAAGGQIGLIGVLTGFGPPSGSLFPLMVRNVRLDGIYAGSRSDLAALIAFSEAHQLHPVIDSTFGFADSKAAFEYLASGQHFGKVVIDVA